ncbi:MAG: THUMP domain-containing protein [Acidobacteriota bacterium]
MRLIATCAVGLESLLTQELEDLGLKPQPGARGAVAFEGDHAAVWRANHWLRTANRVLIEVATWSGQDGDALYAGARNLVRRRKKTASGLDFGRLLSPRKTFAVRATTAVSKQTDTRWIALRVKDGLVDGQRDRHGQRSSVDRDFPDIQLRVRLFKNQATLLLDTSGRPLDHRGYRLSTVQAPLRETLGAAAVLLSGWNGEGPIIDPMCGSGTLIAEAGWWALGRAPSYLRRSWAFENLPGWSADAQKKAVADPPHRAISNDIELIGLDRDPVAIAATESNLDEARLINRTTLLTGDVFNWQPPEGPGLVLINPPYGERLRSAPDAWKHIGDLLKRRFTGKTAVIVAGGEDQGKTIGLRPRRRLSVKNGPLDARLLVFDLY